MIDMAAIVSALEYFGYIFIFPGFLFCVLSGLLLAGIGGRIAARLQKKEVPSVFRAFYDLYGLRSRETLIPAAASKTVFLMAPIIELTSLVVLQLFIPVYGWCAFPGVADVLVVFYLLLIPAAAELTATAASGAPDAGEKPNCAFKKLISSKLPLALVILTVGKAAGGSFSLSQITGCQLENGSFLFNPALIPAAAAFLLLLVGETKSWEPMPENGGVPFEVRKLSGSIKLLTMSSLFAALFLGGVGTGLVVLDALIPVCIGAVVTVFTTFIKNVSPSVGAERAGRYDRLVPTCLALISLLLVWLEL